MTIRILIADDQALVRGALSALLDLEPDLEVVAEVGRGDAVLAAVAEHRPDVALLDVEMPGMDGITAAGLVHAEFPDVRVLIVTTFGRPGFLRRAMQSGASGFVVKDTPAAELADAVRRVHQGLRVVDPTLATESLIAGESPLTARETEVLQAAQDGRSGRPMPPTGPRPYWSRTRTVGCSHTSRGTSLRSASDLGRPVRRRRPCTSGP
jgi:two-component system response regulator DesR